MVSEGTGDAVRLTFATLIPLAAAYAFAPQPDLKQTGPTTLLIQYRCAPAHRTQLRQAMLETGLRQFEAWKVDGLLAGYHILFSRYVDTHNWDMLALIQFSTFADVAKWMQVERRTPAGLPPAALALVSEVSTYPVDLARGRASDTSAERPVYLLIPYTYSVAPQTYLQYVDAYVRPQFDGWMREGVLTSYQIFTQRYTAARPWDSLILLEYRDDQSLGAREKTVAKVRQELQSNPEWKALSEGKQSIRVEKEAVIADELRVERHGDVRRSPQ